MLLLGALLLAAVPNTVGLNSTTPRAATLLAQGRTTPPLETAKRIAAVTDEIDELSDQLLKLPPNPWIPTSIALGIGGAVLLGVGIAVSYSLMGLGLPVIAIAVALLGLGLLVCGVVVGVTTATTAEGPRQDLLERRDRLERELRDLQSRALEPLARF
jgi:hypothetical protein